MAFTIRVSLTVDEAEALADLGCQQPRYSAAWTAYDKLTAALWTQMQGEPPAADDMDKWDEEAMDHLLGCPDFGTLADFLDGE